MEAFARDDGLWDIDAHITDVKAFVAHLAAVVREAGEPIHDLSIRLSFDAEFNVVDVAASSDAVPYPGHCDRIAAAYRSLVGLNLAQGFRHAVKERVGGIAGCTHLTELAQILPTVAFQAVAGEAFDRESPRAAIHAAGKPFQLDRCHALRTDGPAVAAYYPDWAVSPSAPGGRAAGTAATDGATSLTSSNVHPHHTATEGKLA